MKKRLKNIVCLFIIVIMTISLTGCGEIKKAEATINNTFVALKELDFETASNYINIDDIMDADGETDKEEDDDSLSIDDSIIMENLFGKLEHKIISTEKIDKNTVVVKTEITAIDMKPILTEYLGKALQYAFANAFANPQPSEEETSKKMEELFIECISKDNLEMVTNEVDIKVIKVDKKWKVESAEELSSALLGGLSEAAEEISNSFNNAE